MQGQVLDGNPRLRLRVQRRGHKPIGTCGGDE
jgi:hypothetical protein